MMKKYLIFYFHGYNSSPATDKVARLKSVFPDTYAFDINIDPDISLSHLENNIDLTLMDHEYLNLHDLEIVFIGTSLGAWYASKLADKYNVRSILINPCYDPTNSLKKFGVSEHIRNKYVPIDWIKDAVYYIAKNDEVIDFNPVKDNLNNLNTFWIDNANHRFNGPEFEKMMNDIKNDI